MTVKITEAQFTRQVIQLAQLRGWRVLHIRPGMTQKGKWVTAVAGNGVGWPDLFMVRARDGKVLAAELKVGRNKATAAQSQWLADLAAAGVPCFEWTPTAWESIERILEEGPA